MPNLFQGLLTGKSPSQSPVSSGSNRFSGLLTGKQPQETPPQDQGGFPAPLVRNTGDYGAAPQTDVSGRPLATVPVTIPKTFMSPEVKIPQVDKTRVAPTFDPTKPQKIDSSVLTNGRMDETVSKQIKDSLGGTAAEELDHIMPLELGGSNDKMNLRLEPNIPGTKNTATDPIENQIAKKALRGDISALDAWRQMAATKGITLKEDSAKNGPIQQDLLEHPRTLLPLAAAQEAITGAASKVGGFVKNLFTKPNESVQKFANKVFPAVGGDVAANFIKDPIKSLKDAVDTGAKDSATTVNNIVQSATKVVANFQDKGRGNLEKAGSVVDLLTSAASAALFPISEGYKLASQLPVIKPAADAVGLIFDTTGKVTAFAADTLLDHLPISQEEKDILAEPIHNVSTLAGQILLGGYIYGKINEGMSAKQTAKDAQQKADDMNHANAWATLGKPKTLEEAQANYREQIKEVHPDRPGGDPVRAKELTNAYNLLKEKGIPGADLQKTAVEAKPSEPKQIGNEAVKSKFEGLLTQKEGDKTTALAENKPAEEPKDVTAITTPAETKTSLETKSADLPAKTETNQPVKTPTGLETTSGPEKKFYINIADKNGKFNFTEVNGKKVDVGHGVDAFVHKSSLGSGWVVSEGKSGSSISRISKTRNEAIAGAKENLNLHQKEIKTAIDQRVKEFGLSPRHQTAGTENSKPVVNKVEPAKPSTEKPTGAETNTLPPEIAGKKALREEEPKPKKIHDEAFKSFEKKAILPSKESLLATEARKYKSAEEFVKAQKTGNISSESYKNIDASLKSYSPQKFPILKKEIVLKDGSQVELRQSGETLQYVKTNKAGDIIRDSKGMATYMTPEEIKTKGLPIKDTTIVAFDKSGKALGTASNEWGADGIFVSPLSQRQGLGTELLTEFRKQFPASRKMGQMTPAGEALAKSYYNKSQLTDFYNQATKGERKPILPKKEIVKKSIEKNKPNLPVKPEMKVQLEETATERERKLAEEVAKNQAGKEYKDIGKKFFGAKKDMAAMKRIGSDNLAQLEEDPKLAYKFVTKDGVLGTNSWEVNKSNDPGVEYMKWKLYKAIPSHPIDNPRARAFFTEKVPQLMEAIAKSKTYSEVSNAAREWGQKPTTYTYKDGSTREYPNSSVSKEYLSTRFYNVLREARVSESPWGHLDHPKDFSFLEPKKVEVGERKQQPKREPLSHIIRQGGEDLANVSPEFLIQEFGHRGVEYGNWVRDNEAKVHIRRYAESMADLEKILGFNIAEMNEKQKLGIAFGARGSGHALAHYEPAGNVINLTKTKGDGAIAHEWGHYLDHTISKASGGKVGYLSGGQSTGNSKIDDAMKAVNKAMREGDGTEKITFKKDDAFKRYGETKPDNIPGKIYRAPVRWPYVEDKIKENPKLSPQGVFDLLYPAYRGRADQIKQLAQFIMWRKGGDSIVAPKGRTDFVAASVAQGEYWSRPQEMFARAFEGYVEDKGLKIGIKNNYLSSVPHITLWIPEAERPPVYAAIDKLVKTIKEELKMSDPPSRGTPIQGVRVEDTTTGKISADTKPLDQRAGFINPSAFVPEAAKEVGKEIKHGVFPQSASPEAQRAADVIRNAKAKIANLAEIEKYKYKDTANFFDKKSDADNISNISQYEKTGEFKDAPEGYGKFFKDSMEQSRAILNEAYGSNIEEKTINYVRRAFEFGSKTDEEKATTYLTNKQYSLSANKSVMKARTLGDLSLDEALADMKARGIKVKPVTTNPELLRQWSLENAHQALAYKQAWKEAKELRLIKFVRTGSPAPEDMKPLDDRVAHIFAPIEFRFPSAGEDGAEYEGVKEVGRYYADPHVARIFDNSISRGLGGSPLFRGIRAINNAYNQVQLGFSAFHLTGTAINAGVSDMALGLKQILSGKFIAGGKSIGRSLVPTASFINDMVNGRRFINDLAKDDPVAKKFLEEKLNPSGGRLGVEQVYKNAAYENMIKAWKNKNYTGAVFRIPLAVIQKVASPLMSYAIPRVKIGAFMDLANEKISNLPEDATPEARQRELAKAWDSIDNRFGQLVYDNLFWHGVLKDLAQVSTRSVGWNFGTVRELGGGIIDLKDIPKTKEASDRTLYFISLAVYAGVIGAVYQYLHTGKKPSSFKDLYYPQNGLADASGNPDRTSLPTYMKDVYAYSTSPIATVQHKTSPLLSMMFDLATNRDYYGDMVRNPDDPKTKQWEQMGEYMINNFLPFTVQQAQQVSKENASTEKKVEPFFGFTKAPANTVKSDAQLKAEAAARQLRPFPPRTPEQKDIARQKLDAAQAVREGHYGPLKELVRQGIIKDWKTFIKNAQLSPLQRTLNLLPKAQRSQYTQ